MGKQKQNYFSSKSPSDLFLISSETPLISSMFCRTLNQTLPRMPSLYRRHPHYRHHHHNNPLLVPMLVITIIAIFIPFSNATVSPITLSTESFTYPRPTPFSPHYRPECDLLLPGSLVHKESSPYFPQETDSYYNVPSGNMQDSSEVSSSNELPSDFDIVEYYEKNYGKKHAFESSSPYLSEYSFQKRSSYVPGGHVCITYRDIDRAVSEAKMMLGFFSAPYEVKELSSNMPKPAHVAKVSDILLKATAILAKNHGLTKEAIIYALPRVDTYKTSIGEMCPTFLKPVKCEISKYRTLSGMCNNLQYPSWGSARSAFLRFLPPDYADGLSEPRASKNGHQLPPPRLVSFMLHQDVSDYDHEVTYLVIAWGQMLDHDMTFAAVPRDKNDQTIQCCQSHSLDQHPSCLPIKIPEDDPFYKFFNRQCMNFVRIMPGIKPNCPLGPRNQINAVSSFIDCNIVYGVNQATSKRVREFSGGRLKSSKMYSSMGFKDLLPKKTQNPDRGCERSGHDRNLFCFDSGDDRSNEQLQLAVMHTLWMREHNRIADQLSSLNPHWDDEKLFQESRRIVGAIMQHITYNEFLPIVVGRKTMTKYGINLLKYGYYEGYEPKLNPGIRAEFQAAAFRFGHSILPDTTERYSKFHEKLESIRLSSMLRQPYTLYRPGIVDTFIMGLVNQPAYRVDSELTTEVTNHLFEKPGENFGLDLAAINVMRAREMGVPSYNVMRQFCGLPKIKHFEDLYGLVDNSTIRRYVNLYNHVDDIDFWTAGIAEYPLMGAMVGPTFACVIADQFAHLRKGDRFWYENSGWPSQFTPEQLSELRKVKLARLLCENGDDIDTIQLYPLLAAHPTTNPRVSCHDLPKLDLTYWRDSASYFNEEYKAKSAAKAA